MFRQRERGRWLAGSVRRRSGCCPQCGPAALQYCSPPVSSDCIKTAPLGIIICNSTSLLGNYWDTDSAKLCHTTANCIQGCILYTCVKVGVYSIQYTRHNAMSSILAGTEWAQLPESLWQCQTSHAHKINVINWLDKCNVRKFCVNPPPNSLTGLSSVLTLRGEDWQVISDESKHCSVFTTMLEIICSSPVV